MEDLVEALGARHLKSFVLSSLPLPEHQPQRARDLQDKADRVQVTGSHVLTREDVEAHIAELQRSGERVLGCITVWEGYRHLMALANAQLGVPDLDEKQILGLRDKLALRNRLADAGLTRVRATELTAGSLRAHQASTRRYFVKPVSGIASYGAFPLSPDTTWADIEQITTDAQADTVYASAFGDGLSFLIEDYLPGREFSFEVIVVDGEASIVGIHEKCEVTEAEGTVLENCCTSPPWSISREDCAAGIEWVVSLLSHLGLRWGCFHIEARHHQSRWDLIEVNPRVGGSLISHSVKALNGEWDLLDLWLDLLLSGADEETDEAKSFRARLREISFAADGTSPVENATFFRVFFAEKGVIKKVGLNSELPLKPVVSQILLKAGDTVESTSREVFLGQLLWQLRLDERDQQLPELMRTSEDAIEIHYEAEAQSRG
ncbi:ATP-grasp domain-containing protein [Kitasatospora sp. GP82]|uniref:ATP-grasp domain-containing protein n=1 Tax=Kitasatospora sp. GP82 TaxID=3035089 RepID=UPI002475C84D|nr:ATP-grasp domain-containing protein [Kitasatospora sp. GP82]